MFCLLVFFIYFSKFHVPFFLFVLIFLFIYFSFHFNFRVLTDTQFCKTQQLILLKPNRTKSPTHSETWYVQSQIHNNNVH